MTTLHLDYETASEVDLRSAGAHVYAAHKSTRILMLGWAFDDEPVSLWEPHLCAIPPARLVQGLTDPSVICEAANAQFERLITYYCLGIHMPYERWRCTLVKAYYLGFAKGLDAILEQVGLRKKDPRGSRLIAKFCGPAPRNHKADWYDWRNSPEDWADFRQYCITDVEVERELSKWLDNYPGMHLWDWQRYFLDQRINDRGVYLDVDFSRQALDLWEKERERLTQELEQITGLTTVSRNPFLNYLNSQLPHADAFSSLDKDYVTSRRSGGLPPHVERLLDLWQEKEAKATTKYAAVLNGAGPDNRIRGMFQFKGASRTDRTGGRRLQLQNLKRPVVESLDAIEPFLSAIKSGDVRSYGVSMSEALGGAIRHVICAPPGKMLAVADLSSIESVLLGWLTNCKSINDTFHQGRDSYKVFAQNYYGVPYESVTKDMRKFSKPPVLGCFAAETLVLTKEGWVPIVCIGDRHDVWDGVEWVTCDGAIYQGDKLVVDRCGVRATPDHKVLADEWIEWKDLAGSKLERALEVARDSLDDTVCTDKMRMIEPPTSGEYVSPTYDVLNAGPRNRFTILTDAGPVIVHNCGYMLGWKGLQAYAEGYGVTMGEEEARRAVDTFRGMNWEVKDFWYWLYDALEYVVESGQPVDGYRLHIERDADFLRIRLPSGRNLSYYKPVFMDMPAPWDRSQTIKNFTYMGTDERTQWSRISAHAGGVTENIIQSIAVDILFHGAENAERAGLPIVLQVHDELAAEVPEATAERDLQTLKDCMTDRPAWADGLWLGADGFITYRFTKD